MHQGQAVENANNAVGVDGPVDFDRQGLAGELVNHVAHLQRSAVGGGVELEVHRPDHVRPDRAHRPGRRTDTGQALLPAALRNPQALLAPQAADALVVDLPTSTPCRDRAAAPSPTGRSVQNMRSQTRNSASSLLIGGGCRRMVQRCMPTTAHARRSETPNRSRSVSTALRLRFGARTFPPRSP